MSASTFRIVITILVGVLLIWFVKGQIKLIESLEAQANSNTTIDVDANEFEQPKGELPEQASSIGFKYTSDRDSKS